LLTLSRSCRTSQKNHQKIIADGRLRIYKFNLNTQRKEEREGEFPSDRKFDILTPAVAYFLFLCWPPLDNALHSDENIVKLQLYTEMSWMILQVTCLLCEYWRGSSDSGRKWRQSPKSALGAAELYFSFFCWRIFGCQYPGVRDLSFIHWHQIYMWDCVNCRALFPNRDWSWTLLAERLSPSKMTTGSKKLVERVGRKMVYVLEHHIRPLAEHINGQRNPELNRYFLPPKNLRALRVLMRKCVRAPAPFISSLLTRGAAGASCRTSTRSWPTSASTP